MFSERSLRVILKQIDFGLLGHMIDPAPKFELAYIHSETWAIAKSNNTGVNPNLEWSSEDDVVQAAVILSD